ncbi:adenosylmethionine-8-amino-7-oxononanoate aminotransferase [Sinobaca qinghaiensis]|uniref:Adenosylmethionine-8-amino-7-oxononanoate aminotransferase n=1 Tax=Sinobaca qinghaiensis TaxID=342944 RepID=A0A419V4T8_9BACL|nr:aminotransferase [Sinobaca qinghaiensis]RKD73537.1 adenosylmethionine-8-amino-7-oxononanoate aminotransferase [Sinobaca qinghaiensis]
MIEKTSHVQEEKQELLEKDRQYLWHHISPHNENPIIFEKGQGSRVTDIDGNEYLDAMSGLWCVNVGHGRETIAEAAMMQMKKLGYVPLSNSHAPAVNLAEALNDWLVEDYRFFFSNSGSDANEVAFKMARQYHQQKGTYGKYKILSRYRAYHGNSMGAMGATGQASRKLKYEPAGEGFKHVPPPYCYRCPFGKEPNSCSLECASAIENMIEWEGEASVAAVIVEPVITGGGMIVPPDGYLQELRAICDRHDVLLIVDEVICGFGRSGEPFGHRNFDVIPDIVTMAKGITSAYAPLSATAVRQEIYEVFKQKEATSHFRHVNTFGGNPVSCAVALENLAIIEEEKLVEEASDMGAFLAEELSVLWEFPVVGDIRTFGLMAGIELVEDRESKTPLAVEKMNQLLAFCREKGVIAGKNGDTVPGFQNVLTLAPPFIITKDEIRQILAVFKEALAGVTA